MGSSDLFLVECTDPFDLFENVQPLLGRRLPLRNLHWKSPTRPLRSIKTLQVNLKKDHKSNTPLDGANHRRHQIPGLRETPYLKVLLFRCDDNETYKLSARKLAREWVKASTTVQQSTSSVNTQENHDAAEWLIIHVVLPDTPAATQPRTSKHTSGGPSDSTDNVSGKSKWPGRGSSTVLDKLKSDFKSSGKSSVDRVAQIRLQKAGSVQSQAAALNLQEVESQWEDLVEKLKSLILTSFDLRVQQYEEDIRERDSQRNLPGWNFCTFFVLKEGLARGFEAVGLFDDALAGYDELSLGLDLIVREQSLSGGDEHGGSFVPFTLELKEAAARYLKEASSASKSDTNGFRLNLQSLQLNPKDFPIDSSNKPYRDLILANDISVFQFRSYIFSRQLFLLLQAANAEFLGSSSEADQSNTKTPRNDENLFLLADACHRAAEFIGIGARTLRQDLEQGLVDETRDASSISQRSVVITNIVASWTYGVSLQILTQTSTSNLVIPDSTVDIPENNPSDRTLVPLTDGALASEARAGFLDQESYPAQTLEERLSPPSSFMLPSQTKPGNSRLGSEKLASCRAELILLARGILEDLGRLVGWSCGWRRIGESLQQIPIGLETDEEMTLTPTENASVISETRQNTSLAGITQDQLMRSMTDKSAFEELFEWLANYALRHYLASKKNKSTERLVADLALLRYHAKDFETATIHLSRLASFYESSSWDSVGVAMLQLQANCLKALGRDGEHKDTLLKLLASYADSRLCSQDPKQSVKHLEPFINDLLAWNRDRHLVTAQLEQFYEILKQPSVVSHNEGKDGFTLPFTLRSRLGKALHQEGSLKLVLNSTDPSAFDQIELIAPSPTTITDDALEYCLCSHVTTWSEYYVSLVALQIGNVIFTLKSDFVPEESLDFDIPYAVQQKRKSILVYPASGSLEARLVPTSLINLSQTRAIEVELRSGWNSIEYITLRIKPATAGLRIQTKLGRFLKAPSADGIHPNCSENDQAITFSGFPKGDTVRITWPYTLENSDITTVAVKIDITYETAHGTFEYATNCSIGVGLALSVNVQDVFQKQCLYSRFTVGPSGSIPVNLGKCTIEESKHYQVESSIPNHLAFDVFPKEAANFLYKISPKWRLKKDIKPKPLELAIDYIPFDEWSLAVLENKFSQDILASKNSWLRSLTVPLLGRFLEPFRSQWGFKDFELVGMLREVEVPSYDAYDWATALRRFGKVSQGIAEKWLQQWHQVGYLNECVEQR